MIPKVQTWKVTAVETGRVVYVDTINRRFARWIATTDFGMYGMTLTASPVKEMKTFNRPASLEDSYTYGM